MYILTGSAVPQKNEMRHSGTGRISRLTMYPMSLFESKESSGAISLSALFENAHLQRVEDSPLLLEEIALQALLAKHKLRLPS